MGNFNLRIENTFIPSIMQFNEDIINDNGDIFITFCSQNELWINNTTNSINDNIYSSKMANIFFSNTRD
jgi:hypothetical protein